jgi:P4 family phage/plasmid primase-like protien
VNEETPAVTGALQNADDGKDDQQLNGNTDLALLQEQLAVQPDELVALCWSDPTIPSDWHTRSVRAASVMAEAADHARCDLYVSVNTITVPEGKFGLRGTVEEVARWVTLFADWDLNNELKQGAFDTVEQLDAAIGAVSGMLGTRPCAQVDSGHGRHTYWPLVSSPETERPGPAEAKLGRRFGALVKAVAARHGGKADSVFDLARVARMPGSINWKTTPVPTSAWADTGSAITVEDLEERLDEWVPDDPVEDVGTEELSSPSDWIFNEIHERCLLWDTIEKGLLEDEPTTTVHNWVGHQFVRLESAHRLECFRSREEYLAAIRAVEAAFAAKRPDRAKSDPKECVRWHAWAITRVSQMTDEQSQRQMSPKGHTCKTQFVTEESPEAVAKQVSTDHSPESAEVRIPGEGSHTDAGNAARLVRLRRDELRFVPQTGSWLRWDGQRWATDPSGGMARHAAAELADTYPIREVPDNASAEAKQAREAAIKHRKNSLSDRSIRAAARIAGDNPAMQIGLDQLDANAYELNTPSGIVDLRTGTVRSHDPNAWHTKMVGVGYSAAAASPMWDKFLETTFQGDKVLIDYVQELAGCAAIGEVVHHVLPFFYGPGGHNGKTALAEVLKAVFGDYADTAPRNFLLAGREHHPTEIAKLHGKRFVVCSEIEEGSHFDEAKVKELTGGDTLTGRFMRQDFFTFQPSHTLLLLGNDQPTVRTGGNSLWRRVRLIPFNHQVPVAERIDKYDEKLISAEGPAILAWVVEGAMRVLRSGLSEPLSVADATREYADSEDTLGRFIEECVTEVTKDFREPSGKVYVRYQQWCRANGIEPKAANVFSRDLSKRGFDVGRSHGKRYIYGVMLDRDPNAAVLPE